MLLLNSEDIRRCSNLPNLIGALEKAFRGFALAPPAAPQRLMMVHERQKAFSLFMPAFLPESQTLGIKVSSFHSANAARGLSAVNGAILLMDVETGQLLAMLDSGALTAIRTSAMSALATDRLCPPGRVDLAVIGAGVQADAHIRAMAAIRELRQVRVFSRRIEQSLALASRLSEELSLSITAVRSMDEALAGADIVCTTTSHEGSQPLIRAHQLKPIAHINAVGGSSLQACEIDPWVLAEAQVHVDDLSAARYESAEIAQALAASIISENDIREIASLVTEGVPLAGQKHGLSYFRCVGHASQDMVIAASLYALAKEKCMGMECDYLSK